MKIFKDELVHLSVTWTLSGDDNDNELKQLPFIYIFPLPLAAYHMVS